jgi:hypothetical protein
MGRFETEVLATEEDLAALADLSGQWIDSVHDRRPPTRIILDMDSSVSPTHGEQEGSAYNRHFGCTCYHPLFLFNQFGDVERCSLRPGNVHSADDWEGVLKPVVVRYKTGIGTSPWEASLPISTTRTGTASYGSKTTASRSSLRTVWRAFHAASSRWNSRTSMEMDARSSSWAGS